MKKTAIKFIYFAYGSNLDAAQVAARTPGAVFLGRGVLPGFRLTFSSHSARWGGGVANVVADKASSVYGVMWGFSLHHIKQMDVFEGFPNDYTRIVAPIKSLDTFKLPQGSRVSAGELCKGIVYQMRNAQDIHDLCPASDLYYGQIERGYKKYGFPTGKLNAAQQFSETHEIGWAKLDDQMLGLKIPKISHKVTAGHISVSDIVEHLQSHGIRHVIAPDGSILVPKDAPTHGTLSPKVREIIQILQRDPSNSMRVCIESNTNVPNRMKSVVVKNNSLVEGSWILTTKELEELFDHKDYFPVELQLTTEEQSE